MNSVDTLVPYLHVGDLEPSIAMTRLLQIFEPMPTIQLDELNTAELLSRCDTKFLVPAARLPLLVQQLVPHYRMLKIDSHFSFAYHTRYFDDSFFSHYLDHHNSRPQRHRIRVRHYLHSGRVFDEIKFRTVRNVIVKSRLERAAPHQHIDDHFSGWLKQEHGIDATALSPSLDVFVRRTTLVERDFSERLTIDVDLSWQRNGCMSSAESLAVVEIKHGAKRPCSKGIQRMRLLGYRPLSFSKYCIGMARLEPRIKQGRFKAVLRKVLAVERAGKEGRA